MSSKINVLFYSNCQYAGIEFFLKIHYARIGVDVVFSRISNYTSIQEQIEIDTSLLRTADLFIYQPIHARHGVYSTVPSVPGGILDHLRPDCTRIAFPYIYNSGLWPIVPPAEIDNIVGGFGTAGEYLNREVIDELVDQGLSLKDILRRFNSGGIDFKYDERFQASLAILREKEKDCDVCVSDYIESNVRTRRLFFTQNHPSTGLFVCVVNQVLKIIGEDYRFCADDYSDNVASFSTKWPSCSSDLEHWKFGFNGIKKSNKFYRKHIGRIYSQRLLSHIHPLSYSIPEQCFFTGKAKKTRLFAKLIPGKRDTYIYENEADYSAMYQEAMFGYTYCKGGWDCLRHYKIIANKCFPYFVDLDQCPAQTMSNFPKEMILEGMKTLNEHPLDTEKYQELATRLFEYGRNELTCRKSAEYALSKLCERRRHGSYAKGAELKVLMLNCGGRNYSRESLSIGLRQTLGRDFVDFPRNKYLYDKNVFGISGFCDEEGVDRSSIVKKIKNHEFDFIFIANVNCYDNFKFRKIPLWRHVKKYYNSGELAFIFGGDRPPFESSQLDSATETLLECLEKGTCFVREFGSDAESTSTMTWKEYVGYCRSKWGQIVAGIESSPNFNTKMDVEVI